MFKRSVLVAMMFILWVSVPMLSAQDDRFQTSSEEMVRELTRRPVQYRSLVSGSKKRAIVVAQRIENRVEEKTIMVDESADVPRLKVKIEFDYDSSVLKASSYHLLKEVGVALTSKALRHKKIMINGHTDSDGSDRYNLRLSFDRAESVKAYLVSRFNISEDRLDIRGFGEELPIKPNTSGYNKQINRRVEFEIAEN